jgi:PleD family two-component response regulator
LTPRGPGAATGSAGIAETTELGTSKVTGTQAQGPRILVVDDNDDNRYTLTLYLDLEGYRNVEVAEDGGAAIARLEREPFDLVLLDVSTAMRC